MKACYVQGLGKSLHSHQTFCYSFQSEFLLLPQNSNFWMSTHWLHINLVSYCVSGGGMALSFSSGHQLKCLSTLLCTSSIAVVLLWLVWPGFVVQHHQTLQCPSQTATKKKKVPTQPITFNIIVFQVSNSRYTVWMDWGYLHVCIANATWRPNVAMKLAILWNEILWNERLIKELCEGGDARHNMMVSSLVPYPSSLCSKHHS